MTGRSPTIEDAIALAATAHRGQRYASPEAEPYVFHPLRVMLRFDEEQAWIVAVLHDVAEDTPVTLAGLEELGYEPAVVAALDALTHRPDEPYGAYIERVAGDDLAARVKLADLEENLANNRRNPDAPGNRDRIDRYEAAIRRLRPAQVD